MDLILDFEQARKKEGENIRRAARLSLGGRPVGDPKDGVYLDFEAGAHIPEPLVLDGFLFGFLHLAMERARRFVVRGPISARAIRNAQVYMEAWRAWLPDRYKVVEIVPSRIVPEWRFAFRHSGRAIGAYSGGVDATFLALRHAARKPPHHKLSHVLTVHGFDVPLSNAAGFERLVGRTAPLLDALDLKRFIVRTNFRMPDLQEWEHSFGAQMACVLHQFSHRFDYGLLGSSEPYTHMINAWGSTPSTDHLLSGDDMTVVHDGAGFSRTQKVEMVSAHPIARSIVKVCWQGGEQDRNCGHCEKCLRTRLNFAAVGDIDPPCFEGPLDVAAIDRIDVRHKVAWTELVTILEYADARGNRAPWVDALRSKVAGLAREFSKPV